VVRIGFGCLLFAAFFAYALLEIAVKVLGADSGFGLFLLVVGLAILLWIVIQFLKS